MCSVMMSAAQTVTATFNSSETPPPPPEPPPPVSEDNSSLELLTKKKESFILPALSSFLSLGKAYFIGKLSFIGKTLFKGSVIDPRWRITDDGKLRGSVGRISVLGDLINGSVQINFSGGRQKTSGQISYYNINDTSIAQFINLTNNQIYSEEIISGKSPIFLGLLFNGPSNNPTLFGHVVTEDNTARKEEVFFITDKDLNTHAIKNKLPISIPQIVIPRDLLNKLIDNLRESAEKVSNILFKKIFAASFSLSNVLKLITEYNNALNDSFLIKDIFYDINENKISLDSFSDEQINELIGLNDFFNNKINNSIKPQLGNYIILARPINWFSNSDPVVSELTEKLGISNVFASFLLQVPAPFTVTFLKGDELVSADCGNIGGRLNCKIGFSIFPKFSIEKFADYDEVFAEYKQGLIDMQALLFKNAF